MRRLFLDSANNPLSLYCFDSGAFIDSWNKYYPITSFPSVWEKIDLLIKCGQIISVKSAYDEISKVEDEIFRWVKARKHIFIEHDEAIQKSVTNILQKTPELYEADKDRSGADPFIIAAASVKGCIVVSNEHPTARRKAMTIHEACNRVNVRSTNILGFIKDQNWVF